LNYDEYILIILRRVVFIAAKYKNLYIDDAQELTHPCHSEEMRSIDVGIHLFLIEFLDHHVASARRDDGGGGTSLSRLTKVETFLLTPTVYSEIARNEAIQKIIIWTASQARSYD
jgi:hypothetical protein